MSHLFEFHLRFLAVEIDNPLKVEMVSVIHRGNYENKFEIKL